MESDKKRTIIGRMIVRMWRDPDYKKTVLEDPVSAGKAVGLDYGEGVAFTVLEDTDEVKYIRLSSGLTKEDILDDDEKMHGLARLIAAYLPTGARRLCLVQSEENHRYMVLPQPPAGGVSSEIDNDMLLAAASTVQSTDTATTQTAVAETTEAAVSETTEAAEVETSVAVVAEVALVAT